MVNIHPFSTVVHVLDTVAGYIFLVIGYCVVWSIDHIYQLAGWLEGEESGKHWDRDEREH